MYTHVHTRTHTTYTRTHKAKNEQTLCLSALVSRLTVMSRKGVHAFTRGHIPKLDSVVERTRNDTATIRVEIQTHDLRCVPEKGVDLHPRCHVPQLGCVVH